MLNEVILLVSAATWSLFINPRLPNDILTIRRCNPDSASDLMAIRNDITNRKLHLLASGGYFNFTIDDCNCLDKVQTAGWNNADDMRWNQHLLARILRLGQEIRSWIQGAYKSSLS